MPSQLDALHNKDTWVFDLDNTLYPHTSNLFEQVDKKMTAYIMNLLNRDFVESKTIQKDYFVKYGTTLAGLMKNHSVDPYDFMREVHNIDYSPIVRCDILVNALDKMTEAKYVLTNGTKSHGISVLKRLDILDRFDGLFGVEDCNFIPKPSATPYQVFVEKFKIDPKKSVFVEDMAKNLEIPKKMGFSTVYIETNCQYANADAESHYIDYKCDNVSTFLKKLTA